MTGQPHTCHFRSIAQSWVLEGGVEVRSVFPSHFVALRQLAMAPPAYVIALSASIHIVLPQCWDAQ